MPDLHRGRLLVARRTSCYQCGARVTPLTVAEFSAESRRRGGDPLCFPLHTSWPWQCLTCGLLGASLAL